MRNCIAIIAAAVLTCAMSMSVFADIVFYNVPYLKFPVVLQGQAKVNPGQTVSFRHKFGTLHFALDDVRIYKAPTTQTIARRMLGKANRSNNVADLAEAADWSLRHGMLEEFYAAMDQILEIDPKNEEALQIRDLKKRLDVTIADSPELVEKLKSEVRLPDFKIARSKHFILYHDTPDKPPQGRKLNRAEERLGLLELVYESFLLKFYSKGITLDIPEERLMVLLFNDHQAYLDYAESLSPTLINASGFWSPETNISVFYDHGTATHFEGIRDVSKRFKQLADEALRIRAGNAKDIIRTSKTLELLIEITQESSDVEVVSHEATHQMAGNTGLFPRAVRTPRWVHEGLAAYFEAPNGATWAGIGAVNEDRLKWYRALAENDREHSSIDYIVGDKIFDLSGGVHSNVLHAYGQAWAMTHFLVERHFDELMEYYRRLGEYPPETPISHESLNGLFDDVFGEDRKHLENEWRNYMRSLKTDMELILNEKDDD